jgi:CDP-diacylglycerol--glycerol-3-phosphate 3-phosphatidyltransferase/cardiolipin synthase
MRSLPNILTVARIVAVPLVVVLFYWTSNTWADPLAALVFILAAITDWIDGYLARKWGVTTPLGAFLDPVADKLMVATALVLLVAHDPRWYVVVCAMIIIGREIAVSALREWMSHVGARGKVAVSGLGKWKTILQLVGLSLMMYRNDLLGLPIYDIGVVLLIVASVLTLWSMVAYLRVAWPDLRGGGLAPPAPAPPTPVSEDGPGAPRG